MLSPTLLSWCTPHYHAGMQWGTICVWAADRAISNGAYQVSVTYGAVMVHTTLPRGHAMGDHLRLFGRIINQWIPDIVIYLIVMVLSPGIAYGRSRGRPRACMGRSFAVIDHRAMVHVLHLATSPHCTLAAPAQIGCPCHRYHWATASGAFTPLPLAGHFLAPASFAGWPQSLHGQRGPCIIDCCQALVLG